MSPELKLPKAGFVTAAQLPGTQMLMALQTRGTIDRPAIWIKSIQKEEPWRPIVRHENGTLDFTSQATTVYVLTLDHATNGRVVSFDAGRDDFTKAKEVLPESDLVLSSLGDSGLACAQDALYVYGRRLGNSVIIRIPYGDNQKKEEIRLPATGSVWRVSADYRYPGLVFAMHSWTEATRIYRYDPSTRRTVDTKLQPVNPADFSGMSTPVEKSSFRRLKIPPLPHVPALRICFPWPRPERSPAPPFGAFWA